MQSLMRMLVYKDTTSAVTRKLPVVTGSNCLMRSEESLRHDGSVGSRGGKTTSTKRDAGLVIYILGRSHNSSAYKWVLVHFGENLKMSL